MPKQTRKAEMINHRRKHVDPPKKSSKKSILFFIIVILLIVGFVGYRLNQERLAAQSKPPAKIALVKADKKTTTKTKTAPAPQAQVSSACAGNTLTQYVLVSISARHMWACNETTQLYDSAVVTGIEYLPADLTPVGTYYVYAKETNKYLTGCDTTGCWDDYVNYWLPFLDNQYGVYGFHDATWRSPSAFGNISPNSSDASHGCVELPLATAAWLFNWAQVGLKVTIEA